MDRYSYDLQWRSGPVDATSFRAWSSNAARDALRDGCGAGGLDWEMGHSHGELA